MRVDCVSCGQGVIGASLSNPYVCNDCMEKYYKIREALDDKVNKDRALIVYGYSQDGHPWIEGVYRDMDGAFMRMERYQDSKEFGHLTWSNKRVMIGWEDPYRDL